MALYGPEVPSTQGIDAVGVLKIYVMVGSNLTKKMALEMQIFVYISSL